MWKKQSDNSKLFMKFNSDFCSMPTNEMAPFSGRCQKGKRKFFDRNIENPNIWKLCDDAVDNFQFKNMMENDEKSKEQINTTTHNVPFQ